MRDSPDLVLQIRCTSASQTCFLSRSLHILTCTPNGTHGAISLFIFIFFFVRLFSNEDIGSYRAIRGVCIEVFWTYSAHCPMVRLVLLGNRTDNMSTSVLRGCKLLCRF